MVELEAILMLVAAGAPGSAAVGILGRFWLAPTAADERPTIMLETPIHRVQAPTTLRHQLLDLAAGRERFASPPLHVFDRHGGDGRLRRQSTRGFKLERVWAWLPKRGYGPRRRLLQLLGTPIDEFERAGWEPVSLPTRRHSGSRRGAAGERAPETVGLSARTHAQRPLSLAVGANA